MKQETITVALDYTFALKKKKKVTGWARVRAASSVPCCF